MDALASVPVTMCLSYVTLAAGTTTTISTTGTTTYCIRGKAYTKAAISNGATPTTDWATGNAFIPIPIPLSSPNLAGVPNGAAGYASVYMIGLDASGNIKVIQGSIVALDSTGAFITAPQFGGTGPAGSVNSTGNSTRKLTHIKLRIKSVITIAIKMSEISPTGIAMAQWMFLLSISEIISSFKKGGREKEITRPPHVR